jgi:hypothetical protein
VHSGGGLRPKWAGQRDTRLAPEETLFLIYVHPADFFPKIVAGWGQFETENSVNRRT